MAAKRFEELDAWKLADELKKKVYALLARSRARDDRKFCEQIADSAASAPANLAEGFGYYRHPEFAKHTRIAKSSLMETQNHLRDGVDRRLWAPGEIDPLLHLANRAIGASVRLLAWLESTDAPGTEHSSRSRASSTFPRREATTPHPAPEHPAPEHPAPEHPAPEHPAPEHPAPGTSTKH